MAILVVILVSFLFGCGSIEADPVYETPITFWPADQSDMADVSDMVTRLQLATGRADIALDPAGIQIAIVDEVAVFDDWCAGTFRRTFSGEVFIQVLRDVPAGAYCMDRSSTMLHEAIHALNPDSIHTDTGVFQEHASPDTKLDAASLEALCTDFACTAFAPER